MDKPVWHFPKSVAEALAFLQEEKAHLHSGGTGIKKHMLRKWNAVIDTRYMPIKDVKETEEYYEFGSGLTFADIIEFFEEKDSEHILYKGLRRSSSVSLRNRITLGGSIAAFPSWSDLAGPLLVSDAEVTIEGKARNRVHISEYFGDSGYHRKSIITAVHLPKRDWKAYYYRQVRVQFDYPTFTVSVTADLKDGVWKDGRIVVVGTAGKYTRLTDLEEALKGLSGSQLSDDNNKKHINLEFYDKPHCGKEYLAELAAEKVLNGLAALAGGQS